MFNSKKAVWIGVCFSAMVIAAGPTACTEFISHSETGTLRLRLVDSPTPIEGIEAITVVFSSVRIHKSSEAEEDDGSWITVLDNQLSEEDRTFNLLDLVNGVSAVLGEEEVEAGHYSQIRIVLESSTITIYGITSDLRIPSGQQSGVKLTKGFNVDPNVITELKLDFDAGESVFENPPRSGTYKMRPTIRLVETMLSGTISGTVTPTGIGAMVIAFEAGTTTVVTSTYADTTSGGYVLQALLEGTYDLEATADGYNSETETDVSVTAGEDNAGHDFVLTPSGGAGL